MKIGGLFRGEKGLSDKQLALLYYGICIWVRLFGAWLVWKFYDSWEWMRWIIVIIGLLGIWLNFKGIQSDKYVWWSRKFHLIIAGLLVIISLRQIKIATFNTRQILTALLVVDVLSGLLLSFYVKPFNT